VSIIFHENHFSRSQEAELRLILRKDIEDFSIVVNPAVSVSTTGEKHGKFKDGLNASVYYRLGFAV
jgi:hypothetical protein